MRTVRCSSCPMRHGEVEGDRGLADAALRREDREDARAGRLLAGLEDLADAADPVDQVEARERHRQDAVDARSRVGFDRVLRHGQHDDRHAEAGLVDLLDEARALDPALEQRVDEDDVGSELLDLRQRLPALGQDVEQLDLGLRVQKPADVLRDLRHVLDDEQAGLVTSMPSGRRYHAAARQGPYRRSRRTTPGLARRPRA